MQTSLYLTLFFSPVKVKVAVIGGTGLSDPKIMSNSRQFAVKTPYGNPSSELTEGQISGVDCILLSRHGSRHTIPPSDINYRANIWALKEQGCTHILATTACGSLQEEFHKGDLAVLDQFIDRTCKRDNSFYSGSIRHTSGVAHIPMAQPFCEKTRQVLIQAAEHLGFSFHKSGTMITIEGPRFSTKAESKWFRTMGGDLINMTTVPEVCLAKEAAMSYASLAMVTDYDCWKEGEDDVTVEVVLQILKENANKAKEVILKAIELIGTQDWAQLIKENQDTVKNASL